MTYIERMKRELDQSGITVLDCSLNGTNEYLESMHDKIQTQTFMLVGFPEHYRPEKTVFPGTVPGQPTSGDVVRSDINFLIIWNGQE